MAPAALLLLALAAPASAYADGKPYFDATRGDRPARERTPAQTLTKRLGTQAVVDVDAATGTPRMVGRLNGTLTGPSSQSPKEIADAYVRSHLADLGLTPADLDTLSPPTAATSPSGLTQVSYEQSADGIPSANTGLRVNVTRDGRVLNVMGSPAHGMEVDSTTPALDAGEAIRAVQDDLGAFKPLQKSKGPSGATQATAFRGGSSASLELLQRSDGTALVWHVYYDAAPAEFYDAIVDAQTGKVLKRANMTKSISNGLVWERYAKAPNAQALVDIGNAGAWLSDAATTLNGPFVHAWSDVTDNNLVDAGEEVDRTGGAFTVMFQPAAGATCSNDHACGWSGGNTWTTNRAQTTVQAFYFANKFHDHLAAAPIGFNGFENGDKLLLQTDDGANGPGGTPNSLHRNNANMSTPREGQSPTMQMYLFTGQGFRNISGADDAAIVYHEYTHGLSSRLITSTPNGPQALNSAQAGAMGEAWSDWYAMDFLVNEGQATDTGADGELDMGEGTDAVSHNLRSEPIDCPVHSGADACKGVFVFDNDPGGYTYGDFGQIARGPEVHADGEIWAQTLWDLRRSLGSALAEQLITDGMRLTPPEPSFLDARNGIVQADINLGSQHLTQIWSVFANRGMGYFAGTFDGSDTSPTEDSSPPPPANAPKGSITGTVTDADTHLPIANAKVGVAGLTSGLYNFSATTDANGHYLITGVFEGSYPRLNFSADGYDATWRGPFGAAGPDDPRVLVLGGQTTSRSVVLRRNWVSLNGNPPYAESNHTEYANLGCGPAEAIDQSLGTGWSSDIPANSVDDPFLIVKLPSSTALTLTSFAADPGAACGDDLENATAQLRVDTSMTTSSTCTTGSWVPARTMSFGAGAGGKLNEFNPDAGAVAARCVRLTLLRSVDEGTASFRDLSEFGVYTTPPPAQPAAVNPTPTPTATPAPSATPVPTPTPTPTPPAVKPVTFKLPTSGSKGSAVLSVTCTAECTATATLTADKATAKKLKLKTLGVAAKAGRGTLKFTVKLSSKARKALKKRHLKSVTVTLKVSVRLGGKTTTSSKHIKIKV